MTVLSSVGRGQSQLFPKWNGNKWRKKDPPPASWQAAEGVTSHSPFGTFHRDSNRNTVQTGFAVTPTKQTTVVLSNRNKKPPPGEMASWLLAARHSIVLPATHTQTGIAVTHSKQTTVVLSSRYKKPPLGGSTTLQPFCPFPLPSPSEILACPGVPIARTFAKWRVSIVQSLNPAPQPVCPMSPANFPPGVNAPVLAGSRATLSLVLSRCAHRISTENCHRHTLRKLLMLNSPAVNPVGRKSPYVGARTSERRILCI
jgi:hypothetical protein